MPSLKLTKMELKSLDALFSEEKWLMPVYSHFGTWFSKHLWKAISKVRFLSKRHKINTSSWPFQFKSQFKDKLKEVI